MKESSSAEGESSNDHGLNMNRLNNITNDVKTFDDSNSTQNQKKDLIDLKTYNGTLMLLFNEMAQTNIHYKVYWFFQYFVPIVQLLLLIISPFIPILWDSENKIGDVIRNLSCALSFSPHSYNNTFDLIGSIVISIIYIIIGIWFCALPAIYLVTRNYPKPILYISVFFSQIVFPFLLIPFSAHVGLVFTSISNDISGGEIFVIIFLVVIFVLVLIGHTFLSSMNAFLISPNPSPIASYKGIHPALVLTCSALYIVLSNLALKFAKWMTVFIIVLHILCNVYFIFDTFSFPFVRLGTHVFATSLYTATIVGHILNIPVICNVKVPEIITIVVSYGVFIIGLIAYYFVFNSTYKKIVGILSYTETQTDNDKREYYDSLNISSSWQFDRMCRIGMSSLSPLFIDWTFPIYAGEMTASIPSMMYTALYVTFFPGEQQAAKYFIDQISKQSQTSFRDRFIIYRIKVTYLRRFSSNSEESTADYALAMKESDSTLSIIRKFWLKISADPNSIEMRELESLGKRIDSAKRKWKNGLETYPNDPRFSSGYSHFLLECLVDPENGVFMKLKSAHLRKGFNSEIDPIFRAFAIARPFIFHEKLCDKKGNIKRNAFEITNGTTVTITATALEKLQEDVDSGAVDKMISDLYHWPNLRKSFKRATSHYKPRMIAVAYALNIFTFIAAIVSIVILFVKILPIFNDTKEYFGRIESAMILRSKIALGRCAMMLHWASSIGISFTEQNYKDEFQDQSILDEYMTLRYYDIEKQVAEAMNYIVLSYLDFAKSFSKFMAKSSNTTYDVLVFSMKVVDRDICSISGEVIGHERLSLKNAIILLIYTYYQSAYGDLNYTQFMTGQLFCQVDTLLRSIPLSIDNGVDFTRFSLLDTLDSNKKSLKQFTAIYVVLIIVFCVLLNFSLIVYYIDAKVIFGSLKSLDQTAAAQGANPVLITAEQEDNNNAVYATERIATFDIVMIVMNVVFTIIMLIVIIVFFTTTLDTNDKTLDFIDWLISGSKRLSLAYQGIAQLFESLILKESPIKPKFTNFSAAYEAANELLSSLWQTEIEFFNGEAGIKGSFTDIDDLHTSDQCKAASSSEKRHDFYHCLGLDQLLSTFIMYGQNTVDTTKFNDSDILNFFHMGSCEVSERLEKSEVLVRDHMYSKISQQITINIIMLIIFLLSLIGLIICVRENAKRLQLIIKAALILLRRIPPPAVANCKQLKDILIGSISSSDDSDMMAQQVIFDSLPTAVLAIARDGTIEAMNEKAKQLFGFITGQIVGQKLDCLIHNVDENELDGNDQISEEDAGAIRLYHMLLNVQEEEIKLEEVSNDNRSTMANNLSSKANINASSKANININPAAPNKDPNRETKENDTKVTSSTLPMFVNCHCSDDSNVRCEASLFPIEDYNGVRNNFILFLGETKEDLSMEAKLKEATEEVTKLKNQLIPSDVQGFIRGDRKDFSFLSKTVTVVAIQIYGFFESIKKIGYQTFLSKVEKLFVHLENGCVQFPPMMKQRQFSDTFIALGGLFNVTDDASVHAQAAIQYATKMVEDTIDQDNKFDFDFRIQVGISTGGPLICGLVGEDIKEFDAAGPLITEAITLAENSAPCRILVTQSTKDLLPDNSFEPGVHVEGCAQTYYVPSFVDSKITLVSSMSLLNISRMNIGAKIPDSMKTTSSLLAQPILEDEDAHEEVEVDFEENNEEKQNDDQQSKPPEESA